MGTMLRKTQLVDRCSCHIISWKICTTMRVEDVTDTLDLALKAFGCDLVHIVHKPSLLSDDGSSYAFRDFDLWQWDKSMKHSRGSPYHPQTQKKNYGVKPRRTRSDWKINSCQAISKPKSKPSSIATLISDTPRAPGKYHPRRRLLRTLQSHSPTGRKEWINGNRNAPLASQ